VKNNLSLLLCSFILSTSLLNAAQPDPDDSVHSNERLHQLIQELTNRLEKVEHTLSIQQNASEKTAQSSASSPSAHEPKTLEQQRDEATKEASLHAPLLSNPLEDAPYDQVVALYNQAMLTKDNSQAASALRAVEAFKIDFPKSDKMLPLLKMEGDLYLSQGQFADGVKIFKDILKKDPKGVHGLEALLSLCQGAITQGKLNEAQVIIKKIEADFGKNMKDGFKERFEALKNQAKPKAP
jgi:TolA-binding protein